MTAVAYTEMIDRAKAAADMHDAFITDAQWLYWLNAELRKLYVRIIRSGYPINVVYTAITATGAAEYDITEPSAVIAVYGTRQAGNAIRYFNIPAKRMWMQLKSSTGTYPYTCYIVPKHTTTGQIGIKFEPNPSSGTYYVVNIPKPDKVVSGTPSTGQSNSVNLPFGWEERIVLGMAQRALTKEETVNPGIEREIAAVDEQIDTHIYDYVLGQSNTVGNTNDFPDSFDVNSLILNYPINYTQWVYL